MYKKYFGLIDYPFRNTPDEDFFFKGSKRGDIVDAIVFSIKRGDAIISVIGEVGSGKTTLIRVVVNRLRDEGYVSVYIPNPNFSSRDILIFIATELGLNLDANCSKFSIYNEISKKLLKVFKLGKRVVIIIDEAHLIPLETLEEIRLLSNLETAKEKLLSIVLVGQQELKKLLSNEEARQLKSRITYEFELSPFSKSDVYEYLNFRMMLAGYNGQEVFPEKVSKKIHRVSKGYPRIINNVAEQVLLSLYLRNKKYASVGDVTSKFTSKNSKYKYYVLILVMISVPITLLMWSEKVSIIDDVSPADDGEHREKKIEYTGHKSIELESPVVKNAVKGRFNSSEDIARLYHLNGVKNKSFFSKDGYSIGVLTTLCTDIDTIGKVKGSLDNQGKKLLVVRYIDGGEQWCKLYLSGFQSYAEASIALRAFPEFIFMNKPYVISNQKVIHLIRQRNAHVEK